jgi:hypothetical protein
MEGKGIYATFQVLVPVLEIAKQHNRYSTRDIGSKRISGKKIIAQVCHKHTINSFLFSAPCMDRVGGECEVSRRLRQGLGSGLGRCAQG